MFSALCIGYRSGDDGVFHISWEDFLKYFGQVDVCMTTSNTMNDLQLDTCEDFGKCGGFLGCVTGCLEYWLGLGCYKLWWNRCCMSEEVAKEQNGGNVDLEIQLSQKTDTDGISHANHDNRTSCHCVCCEI